MISEAKSKSSSYCWVVLAIVCLAAGFSTYAQMAVAARAFEIIPALKLGASQFALIMSAPMFPSIFLCFIIGALADRYGFKIVVTVGLIIAVFGTTFRYLTNNFASYFIMMALTGTGVMCINSLIGKIVGEWFSEEKSGMALGIYYAGIKLGMFFGMATGAMFSSAKTSYLTEGVIMAIATVLWMILAKDAPDAAKAMPAVSMTEPIGVALRSKNTWKAGLGALFYWAGFMAFSGNLANGLNVVHGITPVSAGWLASMVMLGNSLGNLIAPLWADKIGRIKPFMYLAAIGAVILLFGWNAPTTCLWPILFAAGFLIGATLPFFMIYPVLLPEIGLEAAGSAGGLVADLMIIGAVCIPSFVIAPLAGTNFGYIFLLGTFCYLLVGVCSIFLPEMGAKVRNQNL